MLGTVYLKFYQYTAKYVVYGWLHMIYYSKDLFSDTDQRPDFSSRKLKMLWDNKFVVFIIELNLKNTTPDWSILPSILINSSH